MEIHVFWDGPFSLEEIKSKNGPKDYGVYQVYGLHGIYGDSVLLYIGQALKQTFGRRISQHHWIKENHQADEMTFYVGRLAGKKEISAEEWEMRIDMAEDLLIYSHQPIYNMANKNNIDEEKLINVHVFNWNSSKRLLPEVSGKRFTSKYDYLTEANIYTDE